MIPMLLGLASKLNTVLSRLTATRAGYLDRLDATISSRAAASSWTPALAAKLDGATFASRGEVISAAGSGSWTVPDTVSMVLVTLCGGGGSGCARSLNSTPNLSGGAGGGVIYRMPMRVTPGGAVSYAVGAGGASVSVVANGSNYAAGNAGGTTTFGVLSVSGGAGGDNVGAASGGSAGTAVWPHKPFVDGGDGVLAAGGETIVPWYAGGAEASNSGGGGASLFGAGGDGAYNAGAGNAATADPGTGNGSGGGSCGGLYSAGSSNQLVSGAGMPGIIVIEYVG